MIYVCPECGYNAGENGEKILQIHMSAQHGPNSPKFMTSDQLAKIKDENDVVIARSYLVFGGIAVLLGLGITLYGYSVYAMLTCSSISGCFISQSLIDQINTSGFALVYEGSQETLYGGLLLLTFGIMGVTYWRAQKLDFVPRVQVILLVGIFMLIVVTALAIAGGIIPFGQRVTPRFQIRVVDARPIS